MIRKVLQVNADGTQEIIEKELPDDWYNSQNIIQNPTLEDYVLDLDYRVSCIELGI